jgi:OOP family OmpA-OmpF porin
VARPPFDPRRRPLDPRRQPGAGVKARALLLAAELLCAASAASAQQGFALDTYQPVAPQAEWFWNDTLDFRGHQRLGVGLITDYARKPLVLYDQTGAPINTLVSDQLMLHLGVQILWLERIRLAANLPIGLYQTGNTTLAGADAFQPPGQSAFGDPRLSGDVRLFGDYRGPLALALGGEVHLPFGSRTQYTGDGRVRLGLHLRAAGEWGAFAWSSSLGFQYRRQRDVFAGLQHDNLGSADAAAGVRVLDGRLLLGPELHLATQLGQSHSAFDAQATPAELLVGAHYRVADQLDLGAGAGGGLTQGVGAPAFRALLQIAWSPRAAPAPAEPAPPAPEPAPAPAPPPPPQAALAPAPPPPAPAPAAPAPPPTPAVVCPEPPPPPVCPPQPVCAPPPPPCPECPKPAPAAEAMPLPAPPTVIRKVTITATQIVIPHQIKFRLNSVELVPSDDPLLAAVAKSMDEHPELTHVQIEGHTDNSGPAEHNLRLSQGRARSVLNWLVAHGIARRRLSSEGYGDTRPLLKNDTPEHRSSNRRVEFQIIKEPAGARE